MARRRPLQVLDAAEWWVDVESGGLWMVFIRAMGGSRRSSDGLYMGHGWSF